jgi:hypothetical protein
MIGYVEAGHFRPRDWLLDAVVLAGVIAAAIAVRYLPR